MKKKAAVEKKNRLKKSQILQINSATLATLVADQVAARTRADLSYFRSEIDAMLAAQMRAVLDHQLAPLKATLSRIECRECPRCSQVRQMLSQVGQLWERR